MSGTVKKAYIKSIPVMAGYIVLGIGFGILMRNAGFGIGWCAAMSVFVYAGSLQYVGVGLLSGGAALFSVFMTSLMVNARHLFYSISMLDKYKDAGRLKPYLIFSLTDETYSLICDDTVPADTDQHVFRFFVSLFDQCYWVAGSLIGNAVGSLLPFSTAGVEFSMTALFIASFTEQWLTSSRHFPAVTGIVCPVLSLLLFGQEHFLIPAMILITVVLIGMRKKLEVEE